MFSSKLLLAILALSIAAVPQSTGIVGGGIIAPPPTGGPTISQFCSNSGFSSTTQSCTMSSNVAVGDFIYVTGYKAAGTISFSGSGTGCTGRTWTTDTAVSGVSQSTSTAIGTAGPCTITVTSTSSTSEDIYAVVVHGASALDVHGAVASAGFVAGGSTINCPAITTTAASDLVLCGATDIGLANSAWTAGAGFTVTVSGAFGTAIEQEVKTASGAITPTVKYATSANFVTGSVAFKL